MGNKTEINARVNALREKMKENDIDLYLVPTDDFHSSEYVGEYFKCRKFLTGFTGSAGIAVVTMDEAGLWTDGRYFLQAGKQLEGTCVTLYKMGEPQVPTIREYVSEKMKMGGIMGFDGRCVAAEEAEEFETLLKEKEVSFVIDKDLVGEIWTDRPALSARPVLELSSLYCGEERSEKLKRVRKAMKKEGATHYLLSSLDDIAWLLNIRGGDVECNPVVLSYLLMDEDRVYLFANETVFPSEVRDALEQDGVILCAYDAVYRAVGKLTEKDTVLLNKSKVNSRLAGSIPASVSLVAKENPTTLFKAVKNETEVENMRKAHIRDGVAVTKFIYWLKQTVGKERVTELSAAEKLLGFRKEQEHFMGESFNPIIGYGPHASVIHYSPTKESDIPMEAKGMVLADTGGQYLEGTTDITRTIVLGELTKEEKVCFTAVLQGHLNLQNARFRYGCTGLNLDYIAREPLWKLGKDYNHGTGHGIGFFLNVHEGPNGFRWRALPNRNEQAVLEPGMITSNEPGYYEDGQFGIRHESLIVCVEEDKTNPLRFLHFEPLTMVPFDKDGLILKQMSADQITWLNAYHAQVYETISPYLKEEEVAWLKEATSAL